MHKTTADNRIRHVPVLAYQQVVFEKRRGATVGQIVGQGAGPHNGEFSAPSVCQFVGFATQTERILNQQTVHGFLKQVGMIGGHGPIHIEEAFRIYRNGDEFAVPGRNPNEPITEIHLSPLKIEAHRPCGEHDSHVPVAFAGEGAGHPRHTRWQVGGKVVKVEPPLSVERKLDRVKTLASDGIGLSVQYNAVPIHLCFLQAYAQVRIGLKL